MVTNKKFKELSKTLSLHRYENSCPALSNHLVSQIFTLFQLKSDDTS